MAGRVTGDPVMRVVGCPLWRASHAMAASPAPRLRRAPLPRLANESGALARETWSEIGHIQILEGPEKIWVFVEVVRITDYTGELFLHLMSKHPDRETVSQTVFTIDRLGNVTKTPIAKEHGSRP